MIYFPVWTKKILQAAGIYNILWGAWVVLFPFSFFEWFNLTLPSYPVIWQSVGMIVGVYGLGYFIAAYHPQRHWPIIMVGWLGKIFGPVGAFYYLWKGDLTPYFLWINLTNDLIWLPFFSLIMYHVFKNSQIPAKMHQPLTSLDQFHSQYGNNLLEMSQQSKVILIFLRHFGCTFCRETLSNLKHNRQEIEKQAKIVLVHMSPEDQAERFLVKYGLNKMSHISDPQSSLYQLFSLPRGTFNQLFGPKIWLRGFMAGIIKRHGLGNLAGDGFQMPGVFILYQGEILRSYSYQTAADQPDLIALSKIDSNKITLTPNM